MSNLFKSRLRKDVLITFISQMIVMFSVFILNKAFSNLLTIEEFGQYNIIRRTTSVIAFVMLGGIGITLPRYLPQLIHIAYPRNTRGFILACFFYIILNSSITIIICIILQPFFGQSLFGTNNWNLFFILLSYSLFNALANFLAGFYRGHNKFLQYNLVAIIGALLMMVPILQWKSVSVTSIFFIWSVGYFIITLVFGIKELAKERFLSLRIKIKYIKNNLTEVYKYSFPRLIGDGCLFLYSAFPVVYVGHKLGFKDAALFSVGISIITMITPLYSFMGTILLPYVSKSIAEKNFKVVDNLIRKLLSLFLSSAIIIILLMSIFMPYVINIFFSKEYIEVANVARILLWSLLPQLLYLLYRNPIDACAVFPYNTIIIAICLILLVIGFACSYSLLSFAYCFLAVSIIKGILIYISWLYVRKKTLQV